MSTFDPSRSEPEPEGGGKPSFDKQPPQQPPNAEQPGDPDASGAGPYTGAPFGGGGGYGGGNPYDGNPYGGAPSGAPAGGPAPVAGMPPLGTWPHRILARVIDYVIVQVIAFLLVLPFAGFSNRNGYTEGVWVFYALYLVYEGLMLSRDGQTLGKKAMNVRVAMLADGSSPVGSAAWTRAAVYTLPAVLCCGLWWLVNGLYGVFDKPYRQCLHDKAAKTVVVSTN
ncbi:RDD family protein [Kitasatospora sp. LaBMicrA B282]|uniref:RDD family protein n=1 Tax=Kitasatospora sp. LaBMicrA B282 TaxID=3420949 RepID=UPI003D147C02